MRVFVSEYIPQPINDLDVIATSKITAQIIAVFDVDSSTTWTRHHLKIITASASIFD